MTGGLIQLVAYGFDDMYLTNDPQITFFKVVYRRHTNFSVEQIPQSFVNDANFGKTSTAFISKNGDLVGKILLVITLPKITELPGISQSTATTIGTNISVQFAWVKRIGFSLIKSIEIEINGRVIDRHYGEWLSIWAELTGELRNGHSRGFKKMIGDIPELTNFSLTKEQYTLFIPLQFWFCRSSGNALPLVALQYSDVKINIEFEDATNCFMLSPTHSIKCRDDIVNFIPYEYIEQNIDGNINAGIFIDYDINSKRLYYYKITDSKLQSIPVDSTFDVSSANQTAIDALLSSPTGLKYLIVGKTSGYSTFAEFKNNTVSFPTTKIRNLHFVKSFLIIEYYFLDDEERFKFSQSKHDYLIEQLYYTPDIAIDGVNYNAKIVADHPTKFMVWLMQLNYIKNSKDYYNYTNSYQNKLFSQDITNVNFGEPMGKSLINTETILINGNQRITRRDNSYFDTIQVYQHTNTSISTGINFYSFGLYPFMTQPSGSCNMSQIDTIEVQMTLSSAINANNKGIFRGYLVSQNILRIVNGLAGLVFAKTTFLR